MIRTIDVTVRGDRKREPDEVFYMNLASAPPLLVDDGALVDLRIAICHAQRR